MGRETGRRLLHGAARTVGERAGRSAEAQEPDEEAVPPEAASPGMPLGDYTEIRELGRTAVLARQGSAGGLGRARRGPFFCVKKVDGFFGRMTAEERQAAAAEAKALRKLRHPNILEIMHVYVKSDTLCTVTEFAEDGDLRRRLKKQRGEPLPEEIVSNWFVQICLAMKYVHDRKLLHRDIRPHNIFLTRGGAIAKLGGFLPNVDPGDDVPLGTEQQHYLAPEIFLGKRHDHKSDIWSLGCVLYELTTLKRAFECKNLHELGLKIMRGKFRPPSSRHSVELRALIADMLNRDPAKRPSINQVLRRPVMQQVIRRFLVANADTALQEASQSPPAESAGGAAERRDSTDSLASARTFGTWEAICSVCLDPPGVSPSLSSLLSFCVGLRAALCRLGRSPFRAGMCFAALA